MLRLARRWWIAGFTLLILLTPSPARATARADPLMTVIGDSLTLGLYATEPADDYVSLLAREWGGPVRSIGVVGATAETIEPDVARIDPRSTVVVVEIGTNDFNRDHTELRFWHDYTRLLDGIRRRAPDAHLVCLGPWQPASAVNLAGARVSYMNEQVYSACGTGWMVSLSGLFDVAADRGPAGRPTAWGPADGFHPNDRGHRLIAGRVEWALAHGK